MSKYITNYNIYDLKSEEDINNHRKVLDPELKSLIVLFLKHLSRSAACVSFRPYYDPVTDRKCTFNDYNWSECNGFIWKEAHLYLFEKYDICLSNEFLNLFDNREGMKKDILEYYSMHRGDRI